MSEQKRDKNLVVTVVFAIDLYFNYAVGSSFQLFTFYISKL